MVGKLQIKWLLHRDITNDRNVVSLSSVVLRLRVCQKTQFVRLVFYLFVCFPFFISEVWHFLPRPSSFYWTRINTPFETLFEHLLKSWHTHIHIEGEMEEESVFWKEIGRGRDSPYFFPKHSLSFSRLLVNCVSYCFSLKNWVSWQWYHCFVVKRR